MRDSRGHSDQVPSLHTARFIAFGQKEKLSFGDVRDLLVRVRMVGVGLGPGTIVDIEDHGHQLAGMLDAPFEPRSKLFALGGVV
jgi:hypothetical protein